MALRSCPEKLTKKQKIKNVLIGFVLFLFWCFLISKGIPNVINYIIVVLIGLAFFYKKKSKPL